MKKNNDYINLWKSTVEFLKKHKKIFNVKTYAERQLENINNTRPNKDLSLEDQMNDTQKEFVNYLKKVKETGEL